MFLSATVMSVAADNIKSFKGDTCVINTTTLCDKKGYKSTTPLEVYILKGKIVKINPLKNTESKGYFKRVVKDYIPKFIGLKVSKAKKMSGAETVDGVTGATYSAQAVRSNINAAVLYYSKK